MFSKIPLTFNQDLRSGNELRQALGSTVPEVEDGVVIRLSNGI
jgi:hypothetical protein